MREPAGVPLQGRAGFLLPGQATIVARAWFAVTLRVRDLVVRSRVVYEPRERVPCNTRRRGAERYFRQDTGLVPW